MYDPFSILGIAVNSTKEVAKAAYRKLAMKHHPDKGGDTVRFQEIQAAWERIEAGFVLEEPKIPESSFGSAPASSFTKPQDAWPGFSYFYEQPRKKQPRPTPKPFSQTNIVQAWENPRTTPTHRGDFVAHVSMLQAYEGYICEIELDGKKVHVKMPRGVPHNLKHQITIPGTKETVTVISKFMQNAYNFVDMERARREVLMINGVPNLVYRTKDLTRVLEVFQVDLDKGKTYVVEDFLGERFNVKLNRLQDPREPIVVKDRGYVDWNSTTSTCGDERGSVTIYLQVTEKLPPTNLW